MRTLPKALLLLAAACLLFAHDIQYAFANARLRFSGGVLPGSPFVRSRVSLPVRTVALTGDRWTSPNRSVPTTAFAAVLHFPQDSVVSSGMSVEATPFRKRMEYRWILVRGVENGELVGPLVRFSAEYDAAANVVRMGGREYPLRRGNVFDVRLREDGGQEVRQVRATLTGRTSDGPVIDALEGTPRPMPATPQRHPCPPAAAAASKGERSV